MSRLELLFMLLRILTVILCRSSRGIPIINAACCTVTQRGTRKKKETRGRGRRRDRGRQRSQLRWKYCDFS